MLNKNNIATLNDLNVILDHIRNIAEMEICAIEDNIITIGFDVIPPLKVRNCLKDNGFVYDGQAKQWQAPVAAQITEQASDNQSFKNTVLSGDCVEMMQSMSDNSIDMILTDPPYLVNYQDRAGRSIKNDKNPDWVEPVFTQLYRLLKNDSYCVTFCALPSLVPFIKAAQNAGFRNLGQIIWHKDYTSSSYHLAFNHEQALVMAKGYPDKPSSPLKTVQPWIYMGNVLHPTQKHVDILLPLINSFSKEGDMILDPFCGSGSTLEAAACSGRDYFGIELDEAYADIARNRLENTT